MPCEKFCSNHCIGIWMRAKLNFHHIQIVMKFVSEIGLWRDDVIKMETFSALLALCVRNSPVTGKFPAQRPVTRSFLVFFDLHWNKQLSKQSWGWWFEMPSHSLWRHYNEFLCVHAHLPLPELGGPPLHLLNFFHLQKRGKVYFCPREVPVRRLRWSMNIVQALIVQ